MTHSTYAGITLHVVHQQYLRPWRRRWLWMLEQDGLLTDVEGRAWTCRQAMAHGRIARALLAAGDREVSRAG